MNSYIALLRGINVSGQKIIKMEKLTELFVSFGFKNVKTYIQSGNVLFDAKETNQSAINKKIETGLSKALKYEVPVIIRSTQELRDIVKLDPFKKVKTGDYAKPYVTFLPEEPGKKISLPWMSSKNDVQIFQIHKREVYCLSLPYKGKFGFPNAYIEKEFGVPATTRNWNTVNKLNELAEKNLLSGM